MKFDLNPEYITPVMTLRARNTGIKFIKAEVSIREYIGHRASTSELHGILCLNESAIPESLYTNDYYKYAISVNSIADNNAEIPAGAVLIFRKALPKESVINKISIDEIDFDEFLNGIAGELQKEFSDPIAKCNQFINAVKVDNSSYEIKWPGIAHH